MVNPGGRLLVGLLIPRFQVLVLVRAPRFEIKVGSPETAEDRPKVVNPELPALVQGAYPAGGRTRPEQPPKVDEPLHPRLAGYLHEHTRAWKATISRADAFVLVAPECNYGFPAAAKNALDYLNRERA